MNQDYQEFINNINQYSQNDDVEMSPHSEVNPSHTNPHMILEQENDQNNFNLTVQNPEVENLSLNNQDKKYTNKINSNDQNTINNVDLPNMDYDVDTIGLFAMNNEDGDDKLDFYPELPKVDVNKNTASYREYTETSSQQQQESIRVINRSKTTCNTEKDK
jgi:hypothetical protein